MAPSGEELVIRLPREAWVYIQGKVLDPEDKVLPNVHVSPSMKGGNSSPAETVDPSTGAFRYGPYPPGEYQLRVQADGYAAINVPRRELGPNEVWDVGTLKLQMGGSLLVNVLGAQAEPHHRRLLILDADGAYVDNVDVQDGVGRAGPFVPGGYFLQIAGKDVACKLQPFEVRTGVEMHVDVQVQTGVNVEIECLLPDNAQGNDGVQIVLTDGSHAVVLHVTAWASEGSLKTSVCLLPGEYRIEASKDVLRGLGAFTVVAGSAPDKVSVRLVPR